MTGFWLWFWICAAIVALGLIAQILIALWIVNKAKKLSEPAAKLQAIGESLAKAASEKPQVARATAALDQPIEDVLARRRRVLKSKRQRREARERRLVARLKNISYQESRLK